MMVDVLHIYTDSFNQHMKKRDYRGESSLQIPTDLSSKNKQPSRLKYVEIKDSLNDYYLKIENEMSSFTSLQCNLSQFYK